VARISAAKREEYLKGRREKILDAAINVFSEKSFDRANVADIAQSAGMGKGTVYLYFKSKRDIFRAIIAERTMLPKISALVAAADAPLEATLARIAEEYIRSWTEHLPAVRLVLTDAHQFPQQASQVYQGIILPGTEMLAEFLTAQAKAGRIRKLENPQLTARAFIGMLLVYVLTEEMLTGKRTSLKPELWVKEVVHLFLDGIKGR
jgi:TetR/AcrR family fatty acid metabolism transcriptional regulator